MLYIICSQLTSMEHFMLDAIIVPHKYIQIPRMRSTVMRKVSHVFWRLGINIRYNLFGYDCYRSLLRIKSGDEVVFFMVENKEPVLNMASWINKKTRKIVWFWNSVNDGLNAISHYILKDIQWMKRVGCDVATFDPYDANKFKIRYCNQFFNFKDIPRSKIIPEFDFYFIGNPRGAKRENILNEISNLAAQLNLSFNVLMRSSTMNGYISYQDNLSHAANCRCIVEIVRENQTGLSLRPLEALALHKKLMTNNSFIKNYDFYRPENIFIWGEDDNTKLLEFVNSPYKDIPDNILMKYDVNNWLSKLLSQ